MQEYPMRERIYLPLIRWGVPHTDWKYVFIMTMAGFVLPFMFGLTIFGIPAPMFTGIGTLGLSVAFFNLIRYGRRPYWFQHKMQALFSNHRQRRALPQDNLDHLWLRADNAD